MNKERLWSVDFELRLLELFSRYAELLDSHLRNGEVPPDRRQAAQQLLAVLTWFVRTSPVLT